MNKLISLYRFFRTPLLALGLVFIGVGVLYLAVPGLVLSYHNQTWPSVAANRNKGKFDRIQRPRFRH